MNLFETVAPQEKQHTLFKRIMKQKHAPERAVISKWAKDFIDRDNKFAYEFQTTFESCLWELYLHACLKELGIAVDFSHSSPDFMTSNGQVMDKKYALKQLFLPLL